MKPNEKTLGIRLISYIFSVNNKQKVHESAKTNPSEIVTLIWQTILLKLFPINKKKKKTQSDAHLTSVC